jgi:2-(1,2-epoxy-1,2-dihydrophenyl)acetyl-CoA isomerase
MGEYLGTTKRELKHGIGLLTMDFPERRNALSKGLLTDLRKHMTELANDPDCRVIVLTGAEGHFCAGGDVKKMMEVTPVNGPVRLKAMHEVAEAIFHAKKPVIAAVEGAAAGGGMAFAATCDIVVAAEDSHFSGAFSRLGIMPEFSTSITLPMRMGMGRAKLFLMTGDRLSGVDAVQQGLADILVPSGEALGKAMELAKTFSQMPTKALGVTKSVINRFPMSFENGLRTELEAQVQLYMSDDYLEARKAFVERREPVFKGS